MNAFMKLLSVSSLLLLSYVLEAKAPAKVDKKVDAKCFVELLGGGEKIVFWHISSKKFPSLASSIVGKKIPTYGSKHKVKIYKAYECVLQKDDFSSSRAKALDAKTPR